jgi:hypothetical protein
LSSFVFYDHIALCDHREKRTTTKLKTAKVETAKREKIERKEIIMKRETRGERRQ